MIEQNYGGMGECEEKRVVEKCKPDYEAMIKRANIKMARTTAFRDAALAYLEGQTARDKMAELIGELVTECNVYQKTINELIVRQENDKE